MLFAEPSLPRAGPPVGIELKAERDRKAVAILDGPVWPLLYMGVQESKAAVLLHRQDTSQCAAMVEDSKGRRAIVLLDPAERLIWAQPPRNLADQPPKKRGKEK